MKSIQSKILIVVISGLLVITAAVSAIAVNMTHEIMHKDADRILNNVTQKEAAYINDVFESNNIKHVNISVSTNISDSGSIFINEINISCNKNDGPKIKTLLKDIGVKVMVEVL